MLRGRKFSDMTYEFEQLGDVSLSKGNLAWSIPVWSDEFTITFDVTVNSELTEYWHSIFHVTTGSNYGTLGARIPAVWATKDKNFFIVSDVNGNNDYYQYLGQHNLGQLYHIEISQKKNSNDEVWYKISVDGTTFHEVINTKPQTFQNAKLYLSDPWHLSLAPHGTLSNLRIING